MGGRTDVIEAADEGPVIAAPWEWSPQMKLAERAGSRIGIAADEVDVVPLEVGRRQHCRPHRRSLEVEDVATEPPQHPPGVCLCQLGGPRTRRRHADLVRPVALHDTRQLLELNPE